MEYFTAVAIENSKFLMDIFNRFALQDGKLSLWMHDVWFAQLLMNSAFIDTQTSVGTNPSFSYQNI